MIGLPWTLEIASKPEAEGILRSRAKRPRWLVSHGAPGGTVPQGWGRFATARKLRMEFDDIDRTGHAWYIAPSEEDVARILRFGQQLDHGKLLVHCAAGVSRSTASGIMLMTQALGPGSERDVIQHVQSIREPQLCGSATEDHHHRTIHPNPRMVDFADALLDRKGALRRALREVCGY